MSGFVPFEVLSQPIVPGIPNVPYVEQGSFIQVTNTATAAMPVFIRYYPTQPFVPTTGAVKLFVNFIDGGGNVTMVNPAQFAQNNVIPLVQIPSGKTFIFGVQYLLTPGQSKSLVEGIPQDGVGTRGYVAVGLLGSTAPLIQPFSTIRQVFTNYNSSGQVQSVNSSAYGVPFQPAATAAQHEALAALAEESQKILTPA